MPSGRRRAVSENAGGNRWLLTYVDVSNLLLALFVLMVITTSNTGKTNYLLLSLNTSIFQSKSQQPVHITDIIPQLSTANQQNQQLQLENLSSKIKAAAAASKLDINYGSTSIGVVLHLPSDSLFESGSAVLTPSAEKSLLSIIPIINSVPNAIMVAGSTDNVPIHTSLYYSNLELSTARADAVSEFLIANGVSPERIIALGFGQYHPIASNATAIGRQKNRSVDLFIIAEPLQKTMF